MYPNLGLKSDFASLLLESRICSYTHLSFPSLFSHGQILMKEISSLPPPVVQKCSGGWQVSCSENVWVGALHVSLLSQSLS